MEKSNYHLPKLNDPRLMAIVIGGINEDGTVSSKFDNYHDGWPETTPPKSVSLAKSDTD